MKVLKQFKDAPPLLDPIENMEINDVNALSDLSTNRQTESCMNPFLFHNHAHPN